MSGKQIQSIDFSFFYKKSRAVFLCGLLGFLLPTVYGFIVGFPIPHVHDEFAYLLAADTFADGRLTNLTPLFWQHFESPHLLLIPSYMSKYPPMQSLFLAAGQVLFGHPIFGVWFSCGLAAAAVCWMMQAWTQAKWAFLGTVLMILSIGINSYWAQSYWGGMVTALGGALFFGGFGRLLKKISVFQTVMMTLGGIVIINARPFEGAVTMAFALIVLSARLLKNRRETLAEKFKKIILPGALMTAAALAMMGYYNFKVTGDAFNLPYAEHQRQYFSTPLFVFQPKNTNSVGGHYRLKELSDYYDEPRFSKFFLQMTGLPDKIYLRPVYSLFSLLTFMPIFFLGTVTTVFLYAALFPLLKKRKRLILIFAAILFTFACMSLATFWDQYHYSAHLACCFYLLTIEAFRYLIVASKREKNEFYRLAVYFSIPVLILVSIFRMNSSDDGVFRYYGTEQAGLINLSDAVIKLEKPKTATYLRAQIEGTLTETPDKYLLVVSYEKDYSFDDEIVYNHADLEKTQIIWAHDLGKDKNEALMNYYDTRKILLVKLSNSQMEINRLP